MALKNRWFDRTLAAFASFTKPVSEIVVIEEVAILFADRFEPGDRAYQGDQPYWHREVLRAISTLADGGQVERQPGLRLTEEGAAIAQAAVEQLAAEPRRDLAAPDEAGQRTRDQRTRDGVQPDLVAGAIAAPLRTKEGRERCELPTDDDEQMPVMVELNIKHRGGTSAAFRRVDRLWQRVTDGERLTALTDEYAAGRLTMYELKRLVAADAAPITWAQRGLFRVWPDFKVRKNIDASVATVKADAARRAFESSGEGIVWAVIDSGIDGLHPHFKGYRTLHDDAVRGLHRNFTSSEKPTRRGALEDEDGHGTHVAAILAGGLREWSGDSGQVVVAENRFNVDDPRSPIRQRRRLVEPKVSLNGVAPRTKLVSLKVLGGSGILADRVSRVIQALAYVRRVNAASDTRLRIHGVNLSLGYDFEPTWFACGQSPLCRAVDKLVRSGVVVVVAAGNSGYGRVNPALSTVENFTLGMTINDPGNARLAITVGATHRDAPHTYGVSYFSSKGPTGDGRRKPDLLAPGERITSAAAGELRAAVELTERDKNVAVYIEESGTSMAAPHVSGAIAAFLSVRREFIGDPDEVKRIFVDSATSLGRDPNFEGGGLLDVMRALQSV